MKLEKVESVAEALDSVQEKYEFQRMSTPQREETELWLTQDRLNTHKAVVSILEGMKRDLKVIEKECHQKGVALGKRKRAVSVAFGNNQALTDAIQKVDELFNVIK